MNPYAYVEGNPANKTDFMGLRSSSGLSLRGPVQYGPTSMDNVYSQIALREALNQHGRAVVGRAYSRGLARRGIKALAMVGLGSPHASTEPTGPIDTPLTPEPLSPVDCTDDDEPELPDDDYFYFFHGTARANVPAVLNEIKPVSWNTHKHPKGSFFVYQSTEADAFYAAYAMGTHAPGNQKVAVLVGRILKDIYHDLRAKGLIQVGPTPGYQGFPDETVFYPKSFAILNKHWQWIAWYNVTLAK